MSKIDWYEVALRRAADKRDARREYNRKKTAERRAAEGAKARKTLLEAIQARNAKKGIS